MKVINGKDIDLKEFAEMCAAIGARSALDKLEQEKKEWLKKRFDRRLRNTEMLLSNYRALAAHQGEAVYSARKAIELLDGLDAYEDDNLYVESIKKSTERTAIIVAHINKMLDIFRCMCEANPKAEEKRKYDVIKALYIEEEQIPVEEICANMSVTQRTFYRSRKSGIQILSGLLFGVDGLKSGK